MIGEVYHYATDTPFTALCGQQTTVERNGHALTHNGQWVTCHECIRIRATQEWTGTIRGFQPKGE